MTEQLDPYELVAEDDDDVSTEAAWDAEWSTSPACKIEDEGCESCQ